MRQCAGKLEVDVGHGTFTDLGYADDIALFTAHRDNCNEVHTDCEVAAITLGLCTNWQKTKVQDNCAGPPPDAVQMGSQTVDPVTRFMYLGSDIDSGGYSIVEKH